VIKLQGHLGRFGADIASLAQANDEWRNWLDIVLRSLRHVLVSHEGSHEVNE
jgi:hypothetical protein